MNGKVVKGLFRLVGLEHCAKGSLGSFARKTALALSVVALLGGAAAQKAFAAQFFTPEAKQILAQEAKANAKGLPFAVLPVLNAQMAQEGARSLASFESLQQGAAAIEQEKRNSRQVYALMANDLAGIEADRKVDPIARTVLAEGAYAALAQKDHELIGGPAALQLHDDEGHKAGLVALYQPENLWNPSGFEKEYFEMHTGVEGLDAVLGEQHVLATRAFIAGHEIAHLGQTFAKPEGMSDKQFTLVHEADADVQSLKAIYKATGDVSFIEDIMYERAIAAVLLNDAPHASAYEIARYLKGIAPDRVPFEILSQERTLKGCEVIWASDADRPAPERFRLPSNPLTGALHGSSVSLLRNYRQRVEEKLANGELKGDASRVASLALVGLAHFEAKKKAFYEATVAPNSTRPGPSVRGYTSQEPGR